MRLRTYLIKSAVCLAVASIFFMIPSVGRADTGLILATTSAQYLKIFYFRDGSAARDSLYSHYKYIDVLAPQSYTLNGDGMLSGGVDPAILAFTQTVSLKVMPLVTNTAFNQAYAQSLLNDPVKQDAAIQALVLEAKNKNYWGWQIDFEQMDVSYRDRFSAFIKKAHDAFAAQNLVLSVAVIAQTSENPTDYPKNLWNRIIGVYDYTALGINSDFISIMSYDDPLSDGPVARYSWLEQVLKFSTSVVPSNKLSLGIPLYYWKWNKTTGKRVGIGGYDGLKTALARPNAVLGFSALDQVPFITYKDKKTYYTVWYEDGRSLQKKMSLIQNYGLGGFSAWVLGLETPSIYTAFDTNYSLLTVK